MQTDYGLIDKLKRKIFTMDSNLPIFNSNDFIKFNNRLFCQNNHFY